MAIAHSHNIIKNEANKKKKEGDPSMIKDFDIRLVGGLVFYLCVYFFINFTQMTFFGNPI